MAAKLGAVCAGAAVVWLTAVGVGFRALIVHERTAGAQEEAPARWPSQTTLPAPSSSDGPVLVLFLHPQCPCSRATVAELERLMAHAYPRLKTYALLVLPRAEGAQSTRGVPSEARGLRERLAAIPGVDVRDDLGGEQANVFGALTSGEAAFYDSGGRRVFQGGITGSRGHEGDNPGRSAILAILASEHATPSRTDVFGCALHDPVATASPPSTKLPRVH